MFVDEHGAENVIKRQVESSAEGVKFFIIIFVQVIKLMKMKVANTMFLTLERKNGRTHKVVVFLAAGSNPYILLLVNFIFSNMTLQLSSSSSMIMMMSTIYIFF